MQGYGGARFGKRALHWPPHKSNHGGMRPGGLGRGKDAPLQSQRRPRRLKPFACLRFLRTFEGVLPRIEIWGFHRQERHAG
jgi:hypothetical protein